MFYSLTLSISNIIYWRTGEVIPTGSKQYSPKKPVSSVTVSITTSRRILPGFKPQNKIQPLLFHILSDFLNVILLTVRRRSPVARLLRLWVRIPRGAWMFVCCECRVLSGRGLCDELITHPEESYQLWCVVVCDLETSRIGAPYIYI